MTCHQVFNKMSTVYKKLDENSNDYNASKMSLPVFQPVMVALTSYSPLVNKGSKGLSILAKTRSSLFKSKTGHKSFFSISDIGGGFVVFIFLEEFDHFCFACFETSNVTGFPYSPFSWCAFQNNLAISSNNIRLC